ncbi:Protein of unknown function [Bacillus cytotoxicus]|nr:Protein of unknown function [Bacillus cytotoxicus]
MFFQKMMSNKYKELRLLQHSDIDWTVVRLSFVVEGTGIEQSKRM